MLELAIDEIDPRPSRPRISGECVIAASFSIGGGGTGGGPGGTGGGGGGGGPQCSNTRVGIISISGVSGTTGFPGEAAVNFRPFHRQPGTHHPVFFKDVVQSNGFAVNDFLLELTAILDCPKDGVWSLLSGPISGSLVGQGSNRAIFSNPKIGGYYKFAFDVFGRPRTEGVLALPLAGATMDEQIMTDVQRADAFAQRVSGLSATAKRLRLFRWFWSNGAGDYLGLPDDVLTNPSMVQYNAVADSGLGAVVTWYGIPIRMAKMSNFLIGYAMYRIGLTRAEAQAAQAFGTSNDAADGGGFDNDAVGWL